MPPTTPEGVSLNVEGAVERLAGLNATRDEQVAYLVKDHTKAELARIIVAGRVHHAERDIVQAGLVEALAMSVAQMEITRQRLTEAGLGNLGAGALGTQCDFNRAALSSAQRGAVVSGADLSPDPDEIVFALSRSQPSGLIYYRRLRVAKVTARQIVARDTLKHERRFWRDSGYEVGDRTKRLTLIEPTAERYRLAAIDKGREP